MTTPSAPTTPWAHLPNAALIDWIRARPDVPDIMEAAWWEADHSGSSPRLRTYVEVARQGRSLDITLALKTQHLNSRLTHRDAIRALIAWDDCSVLLRADPAALKVLVAAHHAPAILLAAANHYWRHEVPL